MVSKQEYQELVNVLNVQLRENIELRAENEKLKRQLKVIKAQGAYNGMF